VKLTTQAHGAERLEARLMRLVERADIDAALASVAEETRAEAERLGGIEVTIAGKDAGAARRYRIGSASGEARDEEYGTLKQPERPWLAPAFATIAPRLRALLAARLRVARP
jgi:hypothetical protein